MTRSTGVGRGRGGGGRRPGAGRKPAGLAMLEAARRTGNPDLILAFADFVDGLWRRARKGDVGAMIALLRLQEAAVRREADRA